MAKLPLPPADLARDIGIRAEEFRRVTPETLLWRIHRIRGGHVTPWNQLRHYGPTDARFEPHPPPAGEHPDRAVWYAAATPRTALAEVFQRTRTVPLSDTYHLTAVRLTRTVRLLDLTGEPGYGAWATRAGASMALSTGRHDYTSAWARELCDQFPDLDGLAYRAAIEGGLAIALFLPAEDAMPHQAVTSRALSDPALASRIAGVCHTIGYRIVSPYRP
ncbi:MAG: hypothetical protein BGO26_05325 [Actinobacteria bacterium 69-20]|jgi:hypothetical protein|nr:RES family NAD+ phosphorylase [Actinomycetota bacterium]OJV25168.1 MAG: hypothetical protein BGO26_05325 [Actinobacteria bacterium 69-20]